MRIEGGSQNLSRIPGLYVYPVRRYNNSAIPSVDGVDGYRSSKMGTIAAIDPAILERMEPSQELSAPGGRPPRGAIGSRLDLTDLRGDGVAPRITEFYTPGGITNSGIQALGGNLDLIV